MSARSWKGWLDGQGHPCPCPNPFGCPRCREALLAMLEGQEPPDARMDREQRLQPYSASDPQLVVLRLFTRSRPRYLVDQTHTRYLATERWASPPGEPVDLPAARRPQTFLLGASERAEGPTDRLELAIPTRLVRPRDAWAAAVPLSRLRRAPDDSLSECSGTCWLLRHPAQEADPPPPPECLQLPDNLPPLVREIAERVAGQRRGAQARAEALCEFLRQEYAYSLQANFEEGSRLLQFLSKRTPAHCVFFATALALMLRCLDVPTRYVAGFTVEAGDWDATEECYVVRVEAAHAWVEVYLPGRGWAPFDPTPRDAARHREQSEPEPKPEPGNFRSVPPAMAQAELEGMVRLRGAPSSLRRALHYLVEKELDGFEESPSVDPRRLMREVVGRRCSLAKACARRLSHARLLVCVDVSGSCKEYCRDLLHSALAMQRADQRVLVYVHTNGIKALSGFLQSGRPLPSVNEQLEAAGCDARAIAKIFLQAEARRVIALGDKDAIPLWKELHRVYGPRFRWLEPGEKMARDPLDGVPRWRYPVARLAEALVRAK